MPPQDPDIQQFNLSDAVPVEPTPQPTPQPTPTSEVGGYIYGGGYGGPGPGGLFPQIKDIPVGESGQGIGSRFLDIISAAGLMATEGRVTAGGAFDIPFSMFTDLEGWMPSSTPGLTVREEKILRQHQESVDEQGNSPDQPALANWKDVHNMAEWSRENVWAPPGYRGASDLFGDPLNVGGPARIPTGMKKIAGALPDINWLSKLPQNLWNPFGVDFLNNPGPSYTGLQQEIMAKEIRKELQEEGVGKLKGKKGIVFASWVDTPNIPAVKKLQDKIKSAKKLNKRQAEKWKNERGSKVEAFRDRMEAEFTQLEESGALADAQIYKDALNDTFTGEFTKPEWTPLMGELSIEAISPSEYDELLGYIREVSGNDYFEYINNMNSFLAITEGGVIPQRAQLARLEKLFGSEFTEAVATKEGRNLMDEAFEILGIPRTIVSSFDLSAPLRQGRIMGAAYPKEFAEAFAYMNKAFVPKYGEGVAQVVEESITRHPLYSLAESAGVFKAERAATGNVKAREEVFASKYMSKVPGIGMSERAYTTFLNKFRHDIFYKTVSEWQVAGVQKSWKDYKDLADLVNYGTGRGALPKWASGRVGQLLNALFFAPRFATAGPSFLTKGALGYAKDPNSEVSKFWARSTASFVHSGILWLENLHLMGAEVELDPRSSDFGKGKFGPHRFDFWGGYLPLARYTAQFATGQRKTLSEGIITDVDRLEVFFNFMKSKFSPSGAFGKDLITGENFLGEEVSLESLTEIDFYTQRLGPMFMQDVYDAFNFYDDPALAFTNTAAGVGSLLGLYGMGFQTFQTTKDVRNHVANTIFPGKLYDDLTIQQRSRVNGNHVMTAWFDEREAKMPKDSPEDEWFDGVKTYVDRIERIEMGDDEQRGAIQSIVTQPYGGVKKDLISDYLRSKYNAWQTAVTPAAENWQTMRHSGRIGDSAIQLKLWRDRYWSSTAEDITVSDSMGNEYHTGMVDFETRDQKRKKVLQDAAKQRIIETLPDGSPDPEGIGYQSIVARMPLYYGDDPSEEGQIKAKFGQDILEYQNDMDYLSKHYFNVDREVLDLLGQWENYKWYQSSNSQAGLLQLHEQSKSGFSEALEQLTQLRKRKKYSGWLDSTEAQEHLGPFAAYGFTSDQKELALNISRLLLKWGYVELDHLPNALQEVLGPQYREWNQGIDSPASNLAITGTPEAN